MQVTYYDQPSGHVSLQYDSTNSAYASCEIHVRSSCVGTTQFVSFEGALKYPRLTAAPFTDLTPLLESGRSSIKRRSLIFVISDFISAPGWERPLNLLNRRHEVLAVRLFDPREAELPDVGPLIMQDAETGEQLYVDTHDKRFRARFESAAAQREAALSEAFKRSGVDAVSLSTDEDLVRAIVRMATLRHGRRR